MGKEAVKKHYDANKTKVLKSKVIGRIKKGSVPQKSSLDTHDITLAELNEIRKEAGFEPIAEIKEPRKRSKPFKFDLSNIHDTYNKLAEEGKVKPTTAETHYKLIRGLIGETPVKDFYMNKDFEKLKDDNYNPNTAASSAAAVLNVLDTNAELKDKVGEKIYEEVQELFNELKIKKEQHNIKRQQTEEVPKFSSIVKRIEEENAKGSEEVLLINLYDNITARNDFEELSFDTKEPNHIDLGEGTITLREFKKTNKRYKPIIDYPLNKKVLGLLKDSHTAFPRDKVFTKKIRSIFKKAKIGIDLMRHAKISEELAGSKVKDEKKREALREKMLHSPMTQLSYIRKLKD